MNIQKEKYYSIKQIYETKAFPLIKSYGGLRRWIRTDIKNGDNGLFKAVKRGKGSGTRYYILGENIINALKNFKSGKVL